MNPNTTMSLAVMSGKGGVGKTNLTLNLAAALHAWGSRTLLMDCDLGLSNLDVLLGIAPEGTLQDLLLADTDICDVICTAGDDGFDILPAASGVPEMAELDEDMRDLLIRQLMPVLGSYDYVLLDLGAGISPTVQAFAGMTAVRILVVTPEPTSLTDGYTLMKVMASNHDVRDFFVVVNQAENKREAEMSFARLHTAGRRFLDLEPVFLGFVHQDPHVAEAVRRQVPFLKLFPSCVASRDVLDIARSLTRLRRSASRMLQRKSVLRPLPTFGNSPILS